MTIDCWPCKLLTPSSAPRRARDQRCLGQAFLLQRKQAMSPSDESSQKIGAISLYPLRIPRKMKRHTKQGHWNREREREVESDDYILSCPTECRRGFWIWNPAPWSASRGKQRSLRWCGISPSNLKSLPPKSQCRRLGYNISCSFLFISAGDF